MKLTHISAMTLALLLAGCNTVGVFPSQTGKPWKDVDDAGVPVQTGAAECKYQAKAESASATGIAKQADVAGDLYESCMRNRGYLGDH
jgi:hypothetical protein